MKRHHLHVAALTDVGLVRDRNEDSMVALADDGLLIISDGLGGHAAGEVASRMVVNLLPNRLSRGLPSISSEHSGLTSSEIRDIITGLSEELRYLARRNQSEAGMGATLVMALFQDNAVQVASMGDSRAYLYRDGSLRLLTEDHSVVRILVSQGVITDEQARWHEARGRLTRYMGMEGKVFPDVARFDLCMGDRLVLCSDGMTSEVADDTIAEIVRQGGNPDEICSRLVHAAKEAGGRDNITVIVAEWRGNR